MYNSAILRDYYKWLTKIVSDRMFSENISFEQLFMKLFYTDFVAIIPRDENRAEDGKDLRRRFLAEERTYFTEQELAYFSSRECSILELLIALALACEERIMDDTRYGDRTSQWFWGMVSSLGLSSMIDRDYDDNYVDQVIERFLTRTYEPNGRGGLFTIRTDEDLRKVEIWYQMCWYLDTFMYLI